MSEIRITPVVTVGQLQYILEHLRAWISGCKYDNEFKNNSKLLSVDQMLTVIKLSRSSTSSKGAGAADTVTRKSF
jgi:hypothetical protein